MIATRMSPILTTTDAAKTAIASATFSETVGGSNACFRARLTGS
jgi:hypothetical protein